MRVRFTEGEEEVSLDFEENGEPQRRTVKRGEAVDVPSELGKQLVKQGWEQAKQSVPGAKEE